MSLEALPQTQISKVQETWAEVRRGDELQTGTAMYMKLFGDNPGVMKMFRFVETEDLDELRKSVRFQKHAMKLMTTVGKAVDSLDKMDDLSKMLIALGKRHITYGAKVQHFDLVGASLTYAVQQRMGDKFTPEHQAAFSAFYGLVQHHMSIGLAANQ